MAMGNRIDLSGQSAIVTGGAQGFGREGGGHGRTYSAPRRRRGLTFLEQEAARAPTGEARAALDVHRVGAAVLRGAPERAVAAHPAVLQCLVSHTS